VATPAGIDPQTGTKRDIEQIAEFVNSTVRSPPTATGPAMRRGSLPAIKGRHGLNDWLYSRWGNGGNAIYTGVGSLVAMLVSAGAAWATKQPLLFPSLGASAFLFFETPMAEVASPRNTIIGHYVGAAVGFFWLFAFGLIGKPDALAVGYTAGRWAAVALSLSITGATLRLLRAAHPPAGATTLIVSLGLLNTGHDMFILVLAVLLLTFTCGVFNRICGVPAPVWVKPWPGLTAFLRLPSRTPPGPEMPFAGGLLDQVRVKPVTGQDKPVPRQDKPPSAR
jgi:CBS domain-containing membrane protein